MTRGGIRLLTQTVQLCRSFLQFESSCSPIGLIVDSSASRYFGPQTPIHAPNECYIVERYTPRTWRSREILRAPDSTEIAADRLFKCAAHNRIGMNRSGEHIGGTSREDLR